MNEILKNFPDLSDEQIHQLQALKGLYEEWNAQINVISRKNMEEFYVCHVLHSMAIAKFIQFQPNERVLDIGTGGGFPAIPLAILFPETQFHAVDSIAKKIKVVHEIRMSINLKNITEEAVRAEEIKQQFHFIVSRAVTQMPKFVPWTKGKFSKEQINPIKNGIIYLKGGDLSEELKPFPKAKQIDLYPIIKEPFFETKKVVYLPAKIK